jgi:hypothetical protein
MRLKGDRAMSALHLRWEGRFMRVLLGAIVLIMLLRPAFAEGTELRVDGGAVVALPGTEATISLTDVQDVRCPSDVDCYWEGMIRVELTVTDGTSSGVIVLCNMCDGAVREAVAAGRRVTLVGLEPGRDVLDPLSRLIVLEDYTVVLAVE